MYNIIYERTLTLKGAFPMSQCIKNLPAMQETQETQVQYLDQENLLEKEIATRSSIVAWEIPWTKAGGLQSRQNRVYNWLQFHPSHQN